MSRVATVPQLDFDRLTSYVQDVTGLLGLRDWEFILSRDHPARGIVATCTPVPGRRLAELRVCRDFHQLPPPERRLAVVHELVHAHLAGVGDAVRTIESQIGGLVFPMYWANVERELERSVDALANLLAPTMPLPE